MLFGLLIYAYCGGVRSSRQGLMSMRRPPDLGDGGNGRLAAGLVVFFLDAGKTVVEVGALKRARGAKSDRIDVIRAARKRCPATIRALLEPVASARRCGWFSPAEKGVLVTRTKAFNKPKGLIVVALEQLRTQFRGRSLTAQLGRIEQMQIPSEGPIEHRLSVFTLHSIAAPVRFLSTQLAELDPQLLELIKQHPAGLALLPASCYRVRRIRPEC